MADDQVSAMAELSQAIAGAILAMPDLRDPEWLTCSVVAEVSDEAVRLTAYRYTETGPPVPTRHPGIFDLFRELRESMRATGGEVWDVVIVKIHRRTAQLALSFVAGDEADSWRVTPANISRLPELLRPRPGDLDTS